MKAKYDYAIVGAGLFGSIIANEAKREGKSVLVLDRRNHIGGNCFTRLDDGIHVHVYGAHIFRTNDKYVWDYMRQFCDFNNFVNSPIANFNGELYNLPFNMNTFHQLWGVTTPAEAHEAIERQRVHCENPSNLEEHVLNIAGTDIYERLVKGYTEKQWGRDCKDLPASIMKRIPLRFIFDNNYFNDFYQGIPMGGYTQIFKSMLEGCDVETGMDYLPNREAVNVAADCVVYTGAIDEYYDYSFGPLEYRSLRFEEEKLKTDNYQGVAVMNFTDRDTPYTRIIEHKHFDKTNVSGTIISREYPQDWVEGVEPYYPIEDKENRMKYLRYKELSGKDKKIHFGGRLGEYRYYDMQDTIKSALSFYKEVLS